MDMSDEVEYVRDYELYSENDPAFIAVMGTVDAMLAGDPPYPSSLATTSMLPDRLHDIWYNLIIQRFRDISNLNDIDRARWMLAMLRYHDHGPRGNGPLPDIPWLQRIVDYRERYWVEQERLAGRVQVLLQATAESFAPDPERPRESLRSYQQAAEWAHQRARMVEGEVEDTTIANGHQSTPAQAPQMNAKKRPRSSSTQPPPSKQARLSDTQQRPSNGLTTPSKKKRCYSCVIDKKRNCSGWEQGRLCDNCKPCKRRKHALQCKCYDKDATDSDDEDDIDDRKDGKSRL